MEEKEITDAEAIEYYADRCDAHVNFVIKALCRKVMRLEEATDQLIRAMAEAEIIEIDEKSEDDDVRS